MKYTGKITSTKIRNDPDIFWVKLCTFVANITISEILSIADNQIKEFVWELLEKRFFKLTTLKVIADWRYISGK